MPGKWSSTTVQTCTELIWMLTQVKMLRSCLWYGVTRRDPTKFGLKQLQDFDDELVVKVRAEADRFDMAQDLTD